MYVAIQMGAKMKKAVIVNKTPVYDVEAIFGCVLVVTTGGALI